MGLFAKSHSRFFARKEVPNDSLTRQDLNCGQISHSKDKRGNTTTTPSMTQFVLGLETPQVCRVPKVGMLSKYGRRPNHKPFGDVLWLRAEVTHRFCIRSLLPFVIPCSNETALSCNIPRDRYVTSLYWGVWSRVLSRLVPHSLREVWNWPSNRPSLCIDIMAIGRSSETLFC